LAEIQGSTCLFDYMKVAIVINTSWNIYNFRLGLVKALQKAGHEVIAIAPTDAYSQKLVEKGCTFYPVAIDNKGANPLKDLKLTYAFMRLYKKVAPDVILHFTIKPNIYGTLAAKVLGIPVINNVSGLGTVFIRQNLVSKIALRLYRQAFKYPHTVFFQNNDDRTLFLDLKLVEKSITGLLPGSGVNLANFRPAPFTRNTTFVFLVIARLLYDKGIVEFAEACRILRGKGIKASFQLLGFKDPSHLGIPESLLDEWISEGLINYLGTSDNVAGVIAEVDCVVLPSYREGTPKTLLEAAAMAKPIITTDVPGCRETVVHTHNGYLCEVKNAADLADKMLQLYSLSDSELAAMGQNSRTLAEERFDEKVVIERYLSAVASATGHIHELPSQENIAEAV
jgi:glycosyltransferase involved in cell wall biosynthesis